MAAPEHYRLDIGEVILIRDGGTISTVLGSCISLCIYADDGSIGGMNHFVLPKPDKKTATGDELRYGEASCKALIETMLAQPGVNTSALKAKLVGGASLNGFHGISRNIGDLNIEVARRALKRYQIPLISEDVGGESGRNVFFFTATGKVRISLLPKNSAGAAVVDNAGPMRAAVPPKTTPERDVSPKTLPEREAFKPLIAPATLRSPAKKRVLIVDDSKTIQEFLKKIFADDPEIEVVGVANHPGEADIILAKTQVDVMTLDIQMPVMDGVTYLEKLMPSRPIPVVMLTSMSPEDGNHVLKALDLGAIDYIQKPKLADLQVLGPIICEKVKAAANAHVHSKNQRVQTRPKPGRIPASQGLRTPHIVAIGASTGGTVALAEVLTALPADIPPIVIVQHIPPVFSKAFADRLNQLCLFEVKEAEQGDELLMGRVLIAPGGLQMAIVSGGGGRMTIALSDAEPVNRHKPSVDFLFESVAKVTRGKSLGIILTGMGGDGAKGMLSMKQSGSYTVAQNEPTCVVYGMPKEAVKLGGVDQIVGLESIPGVIEKWSAEKRHVA